jgi:hypothetical protein
MNNRNQRRKRHPLVRLLRSIVRLIRAVFKHKQRRLRPLDRSENFDRLPADFERVTQDLPIVTEQISVEIAPVIVARDPLVETIGGLFERIQWQMIPAPIPVKVSAPVPAIRSNLASPSGASLETVGELLDRVKWQIPTTTIQEPVASNSRVLQTRNVSLN